MTTAICEQCGIEYDPETYDDYWNDRGYCSEYCEIQAEEDYESFHIDQTYDTWKDDQLLEGEKE